MNTSSMQQRVVGTTGSVRIKLEMRSTADLATPLDSAGDVQSMSAGALAPIQQLLRHGDVVGIWETPLSWLPAGGISSLVTVDLKQHIRRKLAQLFSVSALESFGDLEIAEAALVLTRYLIVLRLRPCGMGRRCKNKMLDPNSICHIAYLLPALLAIALVSRRSRDSATITPTGLLAYVQTEDLEVLSESTKSLTLTEVSRLKMLADYGLWTDVPCLGRPSLATSASKKPITRPEKRKKPHLPLPDEYVSGMGTRSLWLAKELGPNVIQLAGRFKDALSDGLPASKQREKIAQCLAMFKWTDSAGIPLTALPFPFYIAGKPTDWPPRNVAQAMALFRAVQMAHVFVVALSMGARRSEFLSMELNCVQYAAAGTPVAQGRTYKLVRRHEGELRTWDLPDIAAACIEQQATLVRTLKASLSLSSFDEEIIDDGDDDELLRPGAVKDPLWVAISTNLTSDQRLPSKTQLSESMKLFAAALGMDTAPAGQTLRSHRFRKTLARLVSLALTQAPRLLMDVFGHKSIEMTLYYILTDKALRAEIETVSRELRVMRATELVKKMAKADLMPDSENEAPYAGFGGPAAVSIFDAVKVHREKVHRRGEIWGAANTMELAELLTLQGSAWDQVREGVICTKFPGESGPCNKSKAKPEPSKCSSTCSHRLEEAFLREDVNASIAASVLAYEQSVEAGEQLTSSLWAAQIRTHVTRFADLKAQWAENATVKQVMVSAA